MLLLKLKQVDLFGFKSFCNRERLRFTGNGIAVVVGPNGCGKSNICDAINWVLGAQSAKSLRGARMNDVIFNGTQQRFPAGLATVSIAMVDPGARRRNLEIPSNGSGRNGASHSLITRYSKSGEITVTRKLFRNGDSQYIINGRVVRLRDVHELFLGTGLGPYHYAIIEQGRIGQLLSSRPQDRRMFIEEAAGVTRFKVKRRQSELKLANSRLNLDRVHDILEEIRRQANSLKRQAAQAERYERYNKELREVVSLMFVSRFHRMDTECQRLRAEVNLAQKKFMQTLANAEKTDSELQQRRRQEQSWESQLEYWREELSGLRVETERLRERLRQQLNTIASNDKLEQESITELESFCERLVELEKGISNERLELENVASTVHELRGKLEIKKQEYSTEEAEMVRLQEERSHSNDLLLQNLDAKSRVSSMLSKLEETLITKNRELAEFHSQRCVATHELQEAEIQRELQDEWSQKLKALDQQNRVRSLDLAHLLSEQAAELDAAQKQIQVQRAKVSDLKARRESLQDVLAHRAYTKDAVKDLFDALERNPHENFRPLGILADLLDVADGYEKITEQFLRDELEYVVVGSWDEADEGLKLVRAESEGGISFFVDALLEAGGSQSATGFEDRVLGRLADHIQFVKKPNVAVHTLLPKLRGSYLVEDVENAKSLAATHPEKYFLLPDGTWYCGNSVHVARKTSSGPLILKQQLRDLVPQQMQAAQELQQQEQVIDELESKLERMNDEMDQVRGKLQDTEKQLLAVTHELQRVEERSSGLNKTILESGNRLKELGSERDVCAQEQLKGKSSLAKLENAYKDLQQRLEHLNGQINEKNDLLGKLQESRTMLQTEEATLDERYKARKTSLANAEASIRELKVRQRAARQEIENWQAGTLLLKNDNKELELSIEDKSKLQEGFKKQISQTSLNLQESRVQSGTLEGSIKELRNQVEYERSASSAKQIELAGIDADLKHLNESSLSDLGQPIQVVVEQLPASLTREEIFRAEETHQSIKDKIDKIGPVNILALKEYKETSQRQEFLENQQNDLIDSIRHTRQAIKEIEKATREQFQDAFDAINTNFRQVFHKLFDGGVGEMQLTDPENEEESGIDIVAQPPGKKLQNIALLSGGEKSMTVLALLMATFRYKPSPFCILDEVDAQLDEANIIRFRQMLQEMSLETQFVVITHSMTTMEVADTLYGVSMGDAGVSKLVSVRYADALESDQPQKIEVSESEPVLA